MISALLTLVVVASSDIDKEVVVDPRTSYRVLPASTTSVICHNTTKGPSEMGDALPQSQSKFEPPQQNEVSDLLLLQSFIMLPVSVWNGAALTWISFKRAYAWHPLNTPQNCKIVGNESLSSSCRCTTLGQTAIRWSHCRRIACWSGSYTRFCSNVLYPDRPSTAHLSQQSFH